MFAFTLNTAQGHMIPDPTTGVSGVFPVCSGVVQSFRYFFQNHQKGAGIMKGTYNKIITQNEVQDHMVAFRTM